MNPTVLLSALLATPDSGSQGFDLGKMMAIIIASIFVNNFVLARFLGICPFLGVSKQLDSAIGMGAAVIFVMTLATLGSWAAYNLLLVPMGLTYLSTIAFILIIASLVQLVELILQKAHTLRVTQLAAGLEKCTASGLTASPTLQTAKNQPCPAKWRDRVF